MRESLIKKQFRKDRISFPIFISLIFFIVFINGYPGQMSYDSFYTLREARLGVEGGSYPPFVAYLWRVFDWMVPGPLLMWSFQNILFVIALIGILRAECKNRIYLVLFGAAGIIFFPPVFGVLLTIWKDTLVGAFFLSSIYFIMIVKDNERDGSLKQIAVGLAVLLIFLGMCTRLNAASGAVPLVYLLIHYISKKGWRYNIAMTLIVFATMYAGVYYVSNYRFLTFEKLQQSHPLVQAPFTLTAAYDLIGISKFSEKNIEFIKQSPVVFSSCADLSFVGEGISNTLGNLSGCPKNEADAIRANLSYETMIKLWGGYIILEPWAYLQTRFEYTMTLIGASGEKTFQPTQEFTPHYSSIHLPSRDAAKLGSVNWDAGVAPSRIANISKTYIYVAEDLLHARAWGAYLFAIVVFLARFRACLKNPLIIALGASAFLYFIPFVIIGADAGVRYNFYSVVCCLLLSFIGIFSKKY